MDSILKEQWMIIDTEIGIICFAIYLKDITHVGFYIYINLY